jgi:protein-L-isoaspartate(D-aspartate) O-methyltransferase
VQSLQRRTQNELFKQTSALLPKLGIRPKHLTFGDGYKGLPTYAPFDSIIVTAGHHLSTTFDGAIKIGGKTSDSIREEIQIMTLLKNETQFEKHELGEFGFVPLLEDKTRIHEYFSRYKNVFIG